jgi:hypothetical protein
MIIYNSSFVVALVGLLMYALSTNPKVMQIGIVTYGVGLLAFLLTGWAPVVAKLRG